MTFRYFTLLFFFFTFTNQIYSQYKLSINISDLESNKGEIGFVLIKGENNFNYDFSFGYYKKDFCSIKNKSCTKTFENISEGEYSLIVFHDADSNKKISSYWFGMPKEGVGASKNPKRKAKYSNSKFIINKNTTLDVKINYL